MSKVILGVILFLSGCFFLCVLAMMLLSSNPFDWLGRNSTVSLFAVGFTGLTGVLAGIELIRRGYWEKHPPKIPHDRPYA